VTLERPSTAATEGNSAAVVAMTATGVGTPDAFVGGTAPVTDWTNAQHLLVDMQATGGVYWVQLVTQSGTNWDWCDISQSASVAANTTGTISFALSTLNCHGKTFMPSQVQAYYLLVQGSSGTYRIDNIHLTTN
jgi:hypothetical protein